MLRSRLPLLKPSTNPLRPITRFRRSAQPIQQPTTSAQNRNRARAPRPRAVGSHHACMAHCCDRPSRRARHPTADLAGLAGAARRRDRRRRLERASGSARASRATRSLTPGWPHSSSRRFSARRDSDESRVVYEPTSRSSARQLRRRGSMFKTSFCPSWECWWKFDNIWPCIDILVFTRSST
jgi:hypothetical protein